MTVEQAFNLVSSVAADFKGTLKDHQMLQEALSLIKKEVNKQSLEKDDVDKSET